jgi:hypothetical protein
VKRIATSVLLIAALTALSGCAQGYAGFATPGDALQTYFASARNTDYATTYDSYYRHYRDLVARDEFVSHRRQAAVLKDYRIDSLSQKGATAVATVTLTFESKGGDAKTRLTTLREDLVREADGWKIRVW